MRNPLRPYRIGFSGSRNGIEHHAAEELRAFFKHTKFDEFHHGDCIGADALAHEYVRAYCPRVEIHVHPPDNPSKRAFCQGNVIHQPLPYMIRNRMIVESSDLLVACPWTPGMILRSGTWSTIRHARAKDVGVRIIIPQWELKT